jgi:16S rRNA (guanine(966)-N(2))-methyltransferase RsmD
MQDSSNYKILYAMRIISGQFRGRVLRGTPPAGIRPTSDKLKETIFNILGSSVEGSTFLDGCAGLGGIGIEAISRGASHVVFAEQSRKACRIVRENLQSLDIAEGYKILEMELAKALGVCAGEGLKFDIAFIDPPWDRDDIYENALEKFSKAGLLAADGLLIVEYSKRKQMPEATGSLRQTRTLVQGDSALAFYKAALEE